MVIRKAVEQDIKKVADIYEKLHQYEKINGTTTNWQPRVYPVEETAKNAFGAGDLFVLEDAGLVCGSCILNNNQADNYKNIKWSTFAKEEEVLVIHTLCINPSTKGHGYGKEMIKFALQLAKSRNLKTIRIDTWQKNFPAKNLYEKMGFKLVGEQHVLHMGVIDEDLIYLDIVL